MRTEISGGRLSQRLAPRAAAAHPKLQAVQRALSTPF